MMIDLNDIESSLENGIEPVIEAKRINPARHGRAPRTTSGVYRVDERLGSSIYMI